MPSKDPTNDIYRILDEAGLNAGTLLATREPMARIVNAMRGEIARKLKDYIAERETKERKPNGEL